MDPPLPPLDNPEGPWYHENDSGAVRLLRSKYTYTASHNKTNDVSIHARFAVALNQHCSETHGSGKVGGPLIVKMASTDGLS